MNKVFFQQHRSVILLATAIAISAVGISRASAPISAAQLQSAQHATAPAAAAASAALLSAEELQKIIPASVFFRGQSSTVQYRNAGGIRFPGGELLFAVKVDTGGYSTSIQERYQDYFVSEVPIQFGSHTLPAGAYGVGFVGSSLLVLDLGAHTIFTVPVTTDSALRRPRPLQIIKAPDSGAYRLYSGKQYVQFTQAAAQ